MKTLFDKSVRDSLPRSHKLMLLSLVVFGVSQFLLWGDGSATATGLIGGVLDFTGGGYMNGTGWDLHPQVGIVLVILFAVYLADPDENIPLFRIVGWWVTPILLLTQSQGGATIGAYIGLAALIASVVAAILHFIEGRRTRAPAPK